MKNVEQVLEKHPDHPGKNYLLVFGKVLIVNRIIGNEGIDLKCIEEKERCFPVYSEGIIQKSWKLYLLACLWHSS